MAIYKKVAKAGKYQDDLAISNLIAYITRADKAKSGMIGGSTRAYPDIIAMTTSGKILMIEPKGDHLVGNESKEKAKIGHQWANLAGSDYRYFMVYESKSLDYPGAYSYERFMEIVKGL